MRLNRLLSIVMLLINRKRIQAKDLARLFEVSVRTIYRDIETINEAGIPVVAYPGANGGLGILENYRVDKNILSDEEIISILRALRGLESSLGDKKILHIIEKVTGLIPRNKMEQVNEKCNQVVIDLSGWEEREAFKERVNVLNEAVEGCRAVSFRYIAANGVETERTVEPLQIYFKERTWYLYAFCHLRNDYRFFKLARMKKLQCLETTFQPRAVAGQWYNGQAGREGAGVELKLKFSPRVRGRVEEYLFAGELHYGEDGFLYVTVVYPEDEWVYGFILSFGKDVEVLQPLHIKTIICERAAAILDVYDGKKQQQT
ncbi:Hypothetical protein LUCI_3524 [Lucifera butyrica]|uniref:HTH deoR-type domain-containing protein n=1 Tax=Lucifera butyrica TaxID=1351585 RepID=A0A498RDU2_9FIRM|nr:YafY family protein [Lucifera butyrica]VBB08253.1 Hypothetical protein LUCI_3524 [Lucifera butyrica]